MATQLVSLSDAFLCLPFQGTRNASRGPSLTLCEEVIFTLKFIMSIKRSVEKNSSHMFERTMPNSLQTIPPTYFLSI
jgi:hypothetical protein